MPRPRFHKLPEEKRRQILDAATEVFAAEGYEASFNRLIERCGISKGAMYYYFDDKEDLFSTVVTAAIAPMMDGFEQAPVGIDEADFWDKFSKTMEQMVDRALSNPLPMGLLRQVMKLRGAHELSSPVVEQIMHMTDQWTRQFVENGCRVGAVRDDLDRELLVGIIRAVDDVADEWFINNYDSFDKEILEEWTTKVVDMIRRIVTPRVEFVGGGS